MARPIRYRLRKSSGQIKATINRMKTVGWKGGVILLNSGYGSLDHDLFEQIAAQSADQHSRIELLVCITSKAQTNGFDSYMNWHFSPKNPRTEVGQKLANAFNQGVSELMTAWGRSGFATNPNHQPLVEPVSFEYGGKTFTWDPGHVPFSFGKAPSNESGD